MTINAEDEKPSWGRLVFDEVVDYAKGEAVSYLTDGWIDLDDDNCEDDEEDDRERPPEKRESFNERLERELAKLSGQPADVPSPLSEVRSFDDVSQTLPGISANIEPEPAGQVAGTALRSNFGARPRVFGRKIG